MRRVVLALVVALVVPAGANARPVSLADARTAPADLALVYPGDAYTPVDDHGYYQCAGAKFSDVSAYSWRGGKLGDQRRTRRLTFWRARTGRVTFDGRRFRNRTHRPVLVAGWCE